MFHLPPHIWDALCLHAQATFPDECCGAILSDPHGDEVRRVTNIQNAMHARDPESYPRDAAIAYFMDPKELLAVLTAADSGQVRLKAFYHSHPNHDAYFSVEDKARAMFGDEPSYPEATYIVIAVYDRQVRTIRAYAWEESAKDFVEIPLSTAV